MFPIKVTRLSQRTSQGQSGGKIQRDDRQSKPKKLVWEETELEMMTQSQPLTAWSSNPKSARPPWRLHLCTFFVASSKGRIVYRGDLIRNESDEIVLYADTATTPTALTALNLTLFFGSCEHNLISLSDAMQAFLRALIEEETWVLIPYELAIAWHLEIYLFSQRKAVCATLEVALRTSVGWQVVAGSSRKTAKAQWRGIGTLQK